MSSRLMPPKIGAMRTTVSTISSALVHVEADREAVDAGELLEQQRLALHHRQGAERADVAAEDVVQDAFLGVWRNAARFESAKASGRTWIMSITHHRAIDAIRRRRPTVELPEPEMPPPAALTMPDIWDEVAGRLDAGAIRAALSRLSEVQRQAIELAYFAGLTQQEIAERTRAPLGTVKSRVRLGLLALREELGIGTQAEVTG